MMLLQTRRLQHLRLLMLHSATVQVTATATAMGMVTGMRMEVVAVLVLVLVLVPVLLLINATTTTGMDTGTGTDTGTGMGMGMEAQEMLVHVRILAEKRWLQICRRQRKLYQTFASKQAPAITPQSLWCGLGASFNTPEPSRTLSGLVSKPLRTSPTIRMLTYETGGGREGERERKEERTREKEKDGTLPGFMLTRAPLLTPWMQRSRHCVLCIL